MDRSQPTEGQRYTLVKARQAVSTPQPSNGRLRDCLTCSSAWLSLPMKLMGAQHRRESNWAVAPYTDLRKFLCMSVVSFSSHGTIAGGTYRAGKAGAQATAQSERIRWRSVANRFHAISQASMISARLLNTELASQWLRR